MCDLSSALTHLQQQRSSRQEPLTLAPAKRPARAIRTSDAQCVERLCRCRALQLDVTNQASIAAAAERIRKEFSRLDVLVNNAGISHAGKTKQIA